MERRESRQPPQSTSAKPLRWIGLLRGKQRLLQGEPSNTSKHTKQTWNLVFWDCWETKSTIEQHGKCKDK